MVTRKEVLKMKRWMLMMSKLPKITGDFRACQFPDSERTRFLELMIPMG